MEKIKIGDLVERMDGKWADMNPGDRARVLGFKVDNYHVILEGFGDKEGLGHGIDHLKIVSDEIQRKLE